MTEIRYNMDRPVTPVHRVNEVRLRARILDEAIGWLEGSDVDDPAMALVLLRVRRLCRRLDTDLVTAETA
jgi:hypothetical protein